MKDLNLNFIIRARDLGLSSTLGKAAGSTTALGRSVGTVASPARAMAAATDKASASGAKADQSARRQDRSLSSLFQSLVRIVPPQLRLSAASMAAARDLDRQARSADKVDSSSKRLNSALGGLFTRLKSIGGLPGVGDKQARSLDGARASAARLGADLGRLIGGAITAGGIAFTAFGGSVISTSAKFEQFQTVLTTIEGSSAKAKSSMDWVAKFASTTPYEIDQTMEAFIKLKAYGIDPMDGSLRTLGDGASAMGKDLMAAIEMIADAQTGEFERLKEFGIRASAQGDKVKLTYLQAGKEVTVTAGKSANAIRKAVIGAFDARFKGAMDAQSKTFNGMLSSMKDGWTTFNKAIGDAGVFHAVKSELQGLMAWMTAASSDGSLKRWAGEISDSLVELFRALKGVATSIDWPAFIAGVASGITAMRNFMAWCGGLSGIINGVVIVAIGALAWSLGSAITGLVTFGAAILGVELALAPVLIPIYAVIAGVALLAGAAFLIWRNWAPISTWFKDMWTGFMTWVGAKVDAIVKFFTGLQPAFKSAIDAIWATMPGWLKLALQGAGAVFKIGLNIAKGLTGGDPPAAPPRKPGTPPAAPPMIRSDLPGTPRAQAGFVRNRAQEARPSVPGLPRPMAPASPILPRPMAPARPTVFGASGVAGGQAKAQPVSGKIEIALRQDGPPRVVRATTNQPDLRLQVGRGFATAGG